MKALFISKPFFMEPLGLMYLSASAKKTGHETRLVTTSDNLEKVITEFQPQIIGYSVMTGDQETYLSLNRKLKSAHSFLSIFGGPYATFFPKIIEEEGVDIICRGEGEEAFAELLNTIELKGDISKIKNLGVKTNGGICMNDTRPFAEIDTLPFPDRSLIANFSGVGDGPIKHFIASRGCPFNCSYCFNEQYSQLYYGKGSRVRTRSVDSVIEEVKQVAKDSSTKFVYFQDDTFTLNKDWLGDFSVKYAEQVNTPFHCHVRANTLDKERAKYLKEAGCYSVHIATETANDRIRNEILSRNMSREQILNASKILEQKGIKFMMQNIIGLPTGTIEDDIATLELNMQCQPAYAWVSIFQPYPGTRLGDYCKKNGCYTGDLNDLASNFFDSSPLNFSGEYKSQLSNLQKLFAIFVEYPELHRLGLSKSMIDAPRTPELIESYKQAYTEFRKKADERLFGFRL
jgi:radical SAM superfamily enzyme YgiQ (UPF0313 family)